MKLRTSLASVAALALAASMLTMGTAQAQPPQRSVAHSVTSHSTMYSTWVVKVLSAPDSNNQIRVQLSNGVDISIPASQESLVQQYAATVAAPKDRVSPDDTVFGDCGNSSVEIVYKSNGEPVRMKTGFSVIHEAIYYAWHVEEAGSSGTGYAYNYHASGSLDFDSNWDGSHNSGDNYPTGTYAASVDGPGSWAQLDNGDICFSGGPHDSRQLYY